MYRYKDKMVSSILLQGLSLKSFIMGDGVVNEKIYINVIDMMNYKEEFVNIFD